MSKGFSATGLWQEYHSDDLDQTDYNCITLTAHHEDSLIQVRSS